MNDISDMDLSFLPTDDLDSSGDQYWGSLVELPIEYSYESSEQADLIGRHTDLHGIA